MKQPHEGTESGALEFNICSLYFRYIIE